MSLFNLLKKATRYPFRVLIAKVVYRVRNEVAVSIDNFFDIRSFTNTPPITTSFIQVSSLDLSDLDKEPALYLIQQYLDHKYDLLGSGWIKNSYFSLSPGFEGFQYNRSLDFVTDKKGDWLKYLLRRHYVKKSRALIKLLSDTYEPIDWQKDYKSGYRWNQSIEYRKQPIGHLPGADIKVPWELSRMHHLVQLAIFAISCKEKRNAILVEYKNQILDFIATNPPRMGVNWVCSMDIGIRATNMLIAYDILRQLDEQVIFDERFCRIFSASIYEHGKHIINNLEYSPILTTNHYLANCAGLLFIAAYSQSTRTTDFWLSFSWQEIINEFKKQFHPDGGNFEASTSYHCLSTEMIAYSTALILGIPEKRKKKVINRYYRYFPFVFPTLKSSREFKLEDPLFFPSWYIERLYKSVKFIADVTKPNGNIAQIGDNDSGKFLKFLPKGKFLTNKEACERYINLQPYLQGKESQEPYWDENVLDHQDVTSALFSLFEKTPEITAVINKFENSLIKTITRGIKFVFSYHSDNIYKDKSYPVALSSLIHKTLKIPFNVSQRELKEHLTTTVYPDSGYCIFRTNNLFLIITYGGIGQNGIGGHSHNDKLSFELTIGETDYALDPGSYIYTALPHKRNLYRSTAVHNTLITDFEQNDFNEKDLFRMKNESTGELLKIAYNHAVFYLKYKHAIQLRSFTIHEDFVEIEDFSNVDFTIMMNNFEFYSNGYGKLMRNKLL